jgi:hypothetical protein
MVGRFHVAKPRIPTAGIPDGGNSL